MMPAPGYETSKMDQTWGSVRSEWGTVPEVEGDMGHGAAWCE